MTSEIIKFPPGGRSAEIPAGGDDADALFRELLEVKAAIKALDFRRRSILGRIAAEGRRQRAVGR